MNDKKSNKIKYKINNDLYSEEDFLKDCPNSEFVPTILPPAKRIIAIGDIHGDLELAIGSFKLANLVDDELNWIADPPNTIVVQVGDQIDSCRPIPGVYDCKTKKYPGDKSDDMKILDFFNEMHYKASKFGGAVYSLLGNHELLNAQGRFDYVSYANLYDFKYKHGKKIYQGPNGRKDAFEPGGPVSTMMACSRPSVLVIGSTMFIHAGILPILVKRLDYLNMDSDTKLKYLNAVVRKWLLHKLSNQDDENNKILFVDDSKMSPFWTRIYGNIPENVSLDSNECFTSVKKTLEVFKLGQLVVGHTPQLFTNKAGINGTCYEKENKKLYRVDGGFSKAFSIFGNQTLIQVLEILNDEEFNILTDSTPHEYAKPPDININEREMRDVSKIYSQNRARVKTSVNHKKTKGY